MHTHIQLLVHASTNTLTTTYSVFGMLANNATDMEKEKNKRHKATGELIAVHENFNTQNSTDEKKSEVVCVNDTDKLNNSINGHLKGSMEEPSRFIMPRVLEDGLCVAGG